MGARGPLIWVSSYLSGEPRWERRSSLRGLERCDPYPKPSWRGKWFSPLCGALGLDNAQCPLWGPRFVPHFWVPLEAPGCGSPGMTPKDTPWDWPSDSLLPLGRLWLCWTWRASCYPHTAILLPRLAVYFLRWWPFKEMGPRSEPWRV